MKKVCLKAFIHLIYPTVGKVEKSYNSPKVMYPFNHITHI